MSTVETTETANLIPTTTHTKGTANVGDIVYYSDAANPGDYFEVTGTGFSKMPAFGPDGLYWTDGAPEYTLRSLDGRPDSTSDLRQHGWVLAATQHRTAA